MTWLGYVGTTGMAAMDFLLADRFHVRPGEESAYAETVLRMPSGYACYGPLPDAPAVGPLPSLANGYVTFGCFNNPAKFTPRMLKAWSQILLGVPGAKLLLKYGGLEPSPALDIIRSEFSRHCVEPVRILLEGWSPVREFLAAYNRIDLALDTQPYSGGATTCEALWMGVPVITFPGPIFASRHSTSHLTNAGYGQFVANDIEGYVGMAIEWAGRLKDLAAMRSQMREKVRQSSLCDGPQFARDFWSVIKQAWAMRAAGRGE
jgi:predicted O-linked N-acetylglucosamine transferase (SPINDLY family)